MIPGFEDYTHELTDHEINEVLPVVVKHLKNNIGKRNIVTNEKMCSALRVRYNLFVKPPRMRKIIRHIRITGEILCVAAHGRGYFVAQTKEEMETYIDSLRVRIDAQEYMFKALKWQMDNTYLPSET